MMKKVFSKIISLICIIAIVTSFCVIEASAANATSAISASPSSVTIGKNFTVTLKVTCASIGSVEGNITYDSSIVEFVSGSDAAGTAGTLRLSKFASSDGIGSFTFSLTFKTLKAGSSAIKFTPTEVATFSTEVVSCPSASTTVTVKSQAALSSNANLKSLKVSSGTLSPAFSPNTVNYSVTVPNTVTTLTMSATVADSSATLSVGGSKNLKVGKNVRTVTVRAANGATKTYTINITRQQGEGTTSEPPATSEPPVTSEPPSSKVSVTVDGKSMTVIEDLSEVNIPAGFSVDEVTINDMAVICVKNTAGVTMLYLNDGETNAFYIYDSENISFTKYRTITVKGATYLLVDKPRNTAVPSGFSATNVTINETEVSAWKADGKEFKDFYLIYVSSESGNLGFYLYDAAEDTITRYVDFDNTDKSVGTTPEEIKPFYTEYTFYIIIALSAIVVGLVIALIVVIVNKQGSSDAKAVSEQTNDDLDSINFEFDDEQ